VGIRKIALVTFIASILSLLAPAWNFTQTMVGIVSRQSASGWRVIPMALFAFLSSVIMPVFFFALYRNEGTLRIPKPVKLLSKAAALILALFVVSALWTEFLDPGFTARGGSSDGEARTIGHIVGLLSTFSNAALLLLLVAFNLHTNQESTPDVPGSRLLDQVTKVAVVFNGLVLAFLVVRCLLTPYTYSTLKDFALQNGRTLPPFSALLEEAIRTLVLQACLFTAPLVVFKSQPLAVTRDGELSASSPAILPNQN
jgi:hypothetical protein